MSELSPIPKKILDYFVITEDRGEFAVKGSLKCTCGCEDFSFDYYGKKGGFLSAEIEKVKNEDGKRVVLKAKCNQCNKEILVFDSIIEGYKNYGQEKPDSEVTYINYECKKCGKNNLKINVAYNSYGMDELIFKNKIDWQEYFSAIIVLGKCNECNKKLDLYEDFDC